MRSGKMPNVSAYTRLRLLINDSPDGDGKAQQKAAANHYFFLTITHPQIKNWIFKREGFFNSEGYSPDFHFANFPNANVAAQAKIRWQIWLEKSRVHPEEFITGRLCAKPYSWQSKGIKGTDEWPTFQPNLYVRNNTRPVNKERNISNHQFGPYIPAYHHLFVVVEEIGKDGFLTRKIYENINDSHLEKLKLTPDQLKMEINPEKYGMAPRAPESNIGVARHVMGMNKSPYISTTDGLQPSARMVGKSVFIDIGKAEQAGIKRVQTQEILAALEAYKARFPHLSNNVNQIASKVAGIDKEILLHGGKIPASAIFTEQSLARTQMIIRGARVVQVFGIAFTAYDLGKAGEKSVEIHSARPIAAETVRQIGGWTAAAKGFAIGGSLGAAAGIETGPGAIITGIIGGIVFGTAGYFAADWVADYIYKN